MLIKYAEIMLKDEVTVRSGPKVWQMDVTSMLHHFPTKSRRSQLKKPSLVVWEPILKLGPNIESKN